MKRWMVVLCLVGAGCGSTAASRPRATTSGARSESHPSSEDPSPTRPAPLVPLRPSGAEAVLAPLAASPEDPAAHAAAGRFYAVTDVAGMTLLWGVTHAALGGEDPRVSATMLAVLRDRVSMTASGPDTHSFSTRLAPGSVPVFMVDGVGRAPVAHLIELRVLPGLALWDGGAFDLEVVTALVQSLAVGTHPGSAGLAAHVEVLPWLAALDAAGHLPAFVARLFGSALEAEGAAFFAEHPDALASMEAFVATHPYRPTHAVMPDDLVSFP